MNANDEEIFDLYGAAVVYRPRAPEVAVDVGTAWSVGGGGGVVGDPEKKSVAREI